MKCQVKGLETTEKTPPAKAEAVKSEASFIPTLYGSDPKATYVGKIRG